MRPSGRESAEPRDGCPIFFATRSGDAVSPLQLGERTFPRPCTRGKAATHRLGKLLQNLRPPLRPPLPVRPISRESATGTCEKCRASPLTGSPKVAKVGNVC